MESILFATRTYLELGAEIARVGGFQVGAVETGSWPDGEIHQTVTSPAVGLDALLVAGTVSEADTLEAFDLACTLIAQGARSLTVVIPYFAYSTMERARRIGEAVTAKSRARIWSALPPAPSGNRILILEPHSSGLPHYFEGGTLVQGIDAGGLLGEMLDGTGMDAVLCSPDIGRIKWVDRLAAATRRSSAFVLKRRGGTGGVEALGLSGDVAGRDVVLCDDMVRTGETLVSAAEVCREAGARTVSAAAVHGAFCPGTLDSLRAGGLIRGLRCSDSHPRSASGIPGWPEVFSCAGLVAKALA